MSLTLEEVEAVGVAGVDGAEGREAPLWEAEEDERVGEALREPGLERRPRERKAARPWDAPSGRMNFSLSSRLVRPRAADRRQKREGTSLLCIDHSRRAQFLLQQGAAEAASRVRESQCFLGCRHRRVWAWECRWDKGVRKQSHFRGWGVRVCECNREN